ncbi:hypothetical protein BH11MYX4_BH11MYX4_18260 [soil metagenome]
MLEPELDPFISCSGYIDEVRVVFLRLTPERTRAIWEREVAWMLEETSPHPEEAHRYLRRRLHVVRWYVCDATRETETPTFVCWVFQVDNAVFFRHGTTLRAPVYVLQGSFMADTEDDDPRDAEARALAKGLEASAPAGLRAT